MRIATNGITRIVFIFKHFVIKIPNFRYSHLHWLQGCYANWSERNYCKVFATMDDKELLNKVAPSYYCSIFGLLQVQARCENLDRELTKQELEYFKDFGDLKSDNAGFYKGRVVLLDYS